MSKLYISEYTSLAGVPSSGAVQVAGEPAIAVQVVDYSGGAATSAAFNSRTRVIRVHTDAVCSVRFDGSTATTSYPRMATDQTEYFGVGGGTTLSVIGNV